MAEINIKMIDEDIDLNIRSAINGLIGKPCCRQRVGEYRSLCLGFGERVPHSKKRNLVDSFYGEWEIGTYNAAWRIIRDKKIICGSMEPVDSNAELCEKLELIQLGSMTGIEMRSRFDICIQLDNNIVIEFLCAASCDDEMLHILGPNHLAVEYKYDNGWRMGKSNEPWL